MEQYGEYQDKGVSGTKRKYNTPFKYTNKMPPPKAFDKWGIRRGIAPRTKTGQFEKRKSLNFVLARSIFYKGIKPSLFLQLHLKNIGTICQMALLMPLQ